MKEFSTNRENQFLKITDRVIALSGKDYHVWEVKAEHITTLYFTDSKCELEVAIKLAGEEEIFSVTFPKEIYVQIKTFFTTKLKNVKVRKSSRLHKMMGPLFMAGISAFFTGVLFFLAREIESGESLESEKRSGFVRSVTNYLTEEFGSQGILLGGGIITSFFFLYVLKAYLFPKKGATIDFNYGTQVINFSNDLE